MKAPTSPGSFAAAVVSQIKAERAAADLPIGQLAERAGISSRAITRYLSGEREMTLQLVERFAIALGLDLETILRRASERQGDGQGG